MKDKKIKVILEQQLISFIVFIDKNEQLRFMTHYIDFLSASRL